MSCLLNISSHLLKCGVIKNAKTLAKSLDKLSVPVRFKKRGFTESHQILLNLRSGRATEFCHQLEDVGIFMDTAGRIGVAKVTHRGLCHADMEEIAVMVKEVYANGPKEQLKKRVRRLASR